MTPPAANRSELTPLAFLRRSADVFASRPAVVYGRRSWSYAEFRLAVEAQARAIRAHIQPGDRVAFLAPNVPELLAAHFAVPLAGGILVAVNARLSTPEVRYVLEHSDARLLFSDAEHTERLGDLSDLGLATVIEIGDAEFGVERSNAGRNEIPYTDFLASADPMVELDWEVDNETLPISINYTSGTTGRPKGVMYSHRGAYLNALGEMHHNRFDSSSVYLWTLPLFHCNGWCTAWAVTAAGGTHVCLRAVRPDTVWNAIDDLGVTHLCGSPTVCSTIANAPDAHPLRTALRITTAGAAPSPTVLAQLDALGITVVHVYGLTEVYGPYTICEPQTEWSEVSAAERARLTARQGVAMVQANPIRVVDEADRDVPRDGTTIGEVVMRGDNVMLGYFRDDEATAEAFRGGFFRSGDLAVMHDDGYIELKDRRKDMVISGGENISTIEVENALVSHPSVLDAAVVGYPHEHWGERPKAYVLRRPGTVVDAEELMTHARSLLAGFKVPDYVVFVDELPRTATGKVTKGPLRALDDRPGQP